MKGNYAVRMAIAVIAWAVSIPVFAQAETAPKIIKFIVASSAGSPIDIIARKLADVISKDIDSQVIVVNKGGAGGTIAVKELLKAPADGSAFLITTDSVLTAPFLIKDADYNPLESFSYISKVAAAGAALIANVNVEADNLTELVAHQKASKSPLAYGSWGIGTLPVRVMSSLAERASISMEEIPYQGSPPAIQDLLGGHIPLTFTGANVAEPLVKQNLVKALAIVSDKRSMLLPDVPTFSESGYRDYIFSNKAWVGVLGSSRLSPTVVRHMDEVINTVLSTRAMHSFFSDIGFDVLALGPDAFKKETEKESHVLRTLLQDKLSLQPQ